MKIGVYGGSFDPPHKEHITIAREAVKQLGLDKLFVVPAKIPPHKQNLTLSDGFLRKQMLDVAFLKDDKIEVSDFELKSSEKSYTYITIEHFKTLYSDAEIYFLVGTDMLEDFPTWKNPESILNNAKLFVTQREGEDFEKAKSIFLKAFNNSEDRIIVSKYVGKKVSSTDIRHRLMLGLDVDDKLDESVLKIIRDNNLLSGGDLATFLRKSLPISRLTHTLGVMNLAKTYAKRLKVDEEKAVKAAMLHDVAKYLDPKDYPDFTLDENVPKSVVHQFLGAYIAENVLSVKDEDVLNAIRYHTTGRENMSALEKIVFTADLLEEGRTYEEAPYLRAQVDKDFDEGFKLCLKRLKYFLSKTSDSIYFLTEKCYDFYVGRN